MVGPWTTISLCMIAFALRGGADATPLGGARKKPPVEADDDPKTAPSYRYGQLDEAACLRELRRRKIHHEVVDEARGVRTPVRIPKGVGGVRFHTVLPPDKAEESPWEVFDCRLVLGLHDFASILARHDIDEALIFSAWRPSRQQPKGKPSTRHTGALAVDIFKLGKRAGADDEDARVWLDVKKDWHGRIGATTCGPKATAPTKKSRAAAELRELVCAGAAARLFTTMLTPNYDGAHHNHFHFDITPDVTWRLVR